MPFSYPCMCTRSSLSVRGSFHSVRVTKRGSVCCVEVWYTHSRGGSGLVFTCCPSPSGQHLLEEFDSGWKKLCRKHFKNAVPASNQTWRELFCENEANKESHLKQVMQDIRARKKAAEEPGEVGCEGVMVWCVTR